MKKILLSCLLTMAGLTCTQAQTYKYLTFTDNEGSETSITASGTVLTFADGNLVATTPESEVYTFSIDALKSMRFDETATALQTISTEYLSEGAVEVFDATGRLVYTFVGNLQSPLRSTLPAGIYIVRTGSKTQKRLVR